MDQAAEEKPLELKRKPGRPETIRDEAPRSDDAVFKALRAESLRSHVDSDGDSTDPFFIPSEIRAKIREAGFMEEWKATHVMGKELDSAYQAQLQRSGWVPVPASICKAMLPKGDKSTTIERGGQMLMMKVSELVDESVKKGTAKAKDQVNAKLKALGMTRQGELDRKVNVVKKSYESIPIED